MDDREKLVRLLKAGHRAVTIDTAEEADALELVRGVGKQLGHQMWQWSVLEGVRDIRKKNSGAIAETSNPAGALYWLAEQELPSLMILLDVNLHLEDPHTLRALRTLIARAEQVHGHVVMIDHGGKRPDVIAAHATPFVLSFPDDDAIEGLVRGTLKALHRAEPIEIDLTSVDYRMIIKNLRGLTARQVRQVVRDVVAEDRRFDARDLNSILARKRQLVASAGTLEYVESPASIDDIGGLDNLKGWLARRADSFSDAAAEYGLVPPRGVLLLGVQGAGKSLCAKAIATAWQRPLLKLDPGNLYDRFVGESERRLREALKQAEVMSPIVLWIDEIEKGFASSAAQSTDGGLSQRMFGTLLTWMQDHEHPVFLVATANNIEALPPELLRKGRFDEIFFVDLPRAKAREMIFAIHLRKRGRDPEKFDLSALAEAAEGFSGAEIEQAVVSAMHDAFATKGEPTTASIRRQLAESPPLSVTMAERIERLRGWAADRCVPAE